MAVRPNYIELFYYFFYICSFDGLLLFQLAFLTYFKHTSHLQSSRKFSTETLDKSSTGVFCLFSGVTSIVPFCFNIICIGSLYRMVC